MHTSVFIIAPELIIVVVRIHAEKQLVEAGRLRVVEVAVGVSSAQRAETEPTEVLLTGRAGHLITAVCFLYVGATARAVLAVLVEPVAAEGLLHCSLNHFFTKSLLHELLPLRGGH